MNNKRIILTPFVRCFPCSSEKHQISDLINEKLYVSDIQHKNIDCWAPNIDFESSIDLDKTNEGVKYPIDINDFNETVLYTETKICETNYKLAFVKAFSLEIEELKKHYKEVTIDFGIIIWTEK